MQVSLIGFEIEHNTKGIPSSNHTKMTKNSRVGWTTLTDPRRGDAAALGAVSPEEGRVERRQQRRERLYAGRAFDRWVARWRRFPPYLHSLAFSPTAGQIPLDRQTYPSPPSPKTAAFGSEPISTVHSSHHPVSSVHRRQVRQRDEWVESTLMRQIERLRWCAWADGRGSGPSNYSVLFCFLGQRPCN
ncbi:hypothetical protein BHM03_00023075 [Ensete ventricosum]|nr:hypothetical protein BHM03_00023075 [Ensete ventricosum]